MNNKIMSKKPSYFMYAWVSWFIIALLYFLQFGLIAFPSSVALQVRESININLTQFGILSSAALYTYVLMQIPAGIIYEVISTKKIIIATIISLLVGSLLLALSNSYYLAILGRLLIGFGGSFTFVGALYISRTEFPIALFPILIALTEAMSSLGEISFMYVFSFLKQVQPWQLTLLEISGVLLIIFLIALFFLKEKKCNQIAKVDIRIVDSLKSIFNNRLLILLGINTGCMAAHYTVVSFTWGIPFISKLERTHHTYSTILISILIFGFLLGTMIFGSLSKRFPALKLMLICSVVEVIVSMVIVYIPITLYQTMLLLFISGLVTGGIILNFTLLANIVSKEQYSVSTGFINMFFGLSGIIISPLCGYLYSVFKNLQIASAPVILMSLIALALNLLFNYKKSYRQQFTN